MIVSSYEAKFWFCESISLLHKLFFTGAIHLIGPGTRIQLWSGAIVSIFVYMVYVLTFPFKYDLCDWVQAAALMQLLLTYVSAFLFFDDGSEETASYRTDATGILLTLVNCACFVLLAILTWSGIVEERRKLARNQLRYKDSDVPAAPRPRGLRGWTALHAARTG